MKTEAQTDFEKAASAESPASIVREVWCFIRDSKKWWLAPVLIVLFILGLLLVLSSTAAAPFIYTLF